MGSTIMRTLSFFSPTNNFEASIELSKPIDLYSIGKLELMEGSVNAFRELSRNKNPLIGGFYFPIAYISKIKVGNKEYPICFQRIYKVNFGYQLQGEETLNKVIEAIESFFSTNENYGLTCYALLNNVKFVDNVADWIIVFNNYGSDIGDCYFNKQIYGCVTPLPYKVCVELGGIPYPLSFCSNYNIVYLAKIYKNTVDNKIYLKLIFPDHEADGQITLDLDGLFANFKSNSMNP